MGSKADNMALPLPNAVMLTGAEPLAPAQMSLSSAVPAVVPSVTQSSVPLVGSKAWKMARPLPKEVM